MIIYKNKEEEIFYGTALEKKTLNLIKSHVSTFREKKKFFSTFCFVPSCMHKYMCIYMAAQDVIK